MAYQHTHAAHHSDLPHRVLGAFKSFFSVIGRALVAGSTANHRLKIVERLSAKSDAELAALGIRREDIVRRVFIDMLDV